MRWNAFERLTRQHYAFVGESLAWMAKRLGLLQGQLDDWGRIIMGRSPDSIAQHVLCALRAVD